MSNYEEVNQNRISLHSHSSEEMKSEHQESYHHYEGFNDKNPEILESKSNFKTSVKNDGFHDEEDDEDNDIDENAIITRKKKSYGKLKNNENTMNYYGKASKGSNLLYSKDTKNSGRKEPIENNSMISDFSESNDLEKPNLHHQANYAIVRQKNARTSEEFLDKCRLI